MDYNTKVVVKAPQEIAFNAIANKLNDWWGKTNGEIKKVGDEFTIHFGNAFWKFRVLHFEEFKELTWECIDGQPEFNKEWIGSKIFWKFSEIKNETFIKMIHIGLNPSLNCYDICSKTWDRYIEESLKSYVENGIGMPH